MRTYQNLAMLPETLEPRALFAATLQGAAPAAAGASDSIWIDLSPPVQTQDEVRSKPLFAFYVEDLDGR